MSSRPSTFTLTSPGPLRLYSTQELLAMPSPEWLIEPIMPAGGLVGLYGPPGVGKSFIAIDMALSVASGGFWQGRRVRQGYVLYISAEGGTGIGKRVKAWLETRGVEPREARVAWLTESIPVYGDSTDMDRLFERLEHEIEEIPKLVVIDTLARCFDGDENQQEDMGRFVAGIDRLRREGATVIVVHHTRLDGDRERGNTAFRGAADTMMSLAHSQGKLTLSCNKQKDAEAFEPIFLNLKLVRAWESCVVAESRQTQKAHKASDILAILEQYQELSWHDWCQVSLKAGISKKTFNRYLVTLKQNEEIIKENGVYRLS